MHPMGLVFEHALDAAVGYADREETVAELMALSCRDRSALEAARLRIMGLVMTRPHDQHGREALSLLDEALRRGDERWRWRYVRAFDPWDIEANARD